MRILIVDDDSICLDMLSATLATDGHEVVAVRNGIEAVQRVYDDAFRMVISDWMMPGMDGIDLCSRVRETQHNGGGYVYIILLTSRNRSEDTITGLSAGADDFLTKPFDPVELRLRVRAGERMLSLETSHLTIFALAKLAESRDPETGRHLERIREYTRIIARGLEVIGAPGQLSADAIETLYLTSPLHDIGKVGLPDSILLKPERLSEEEFRLMTQHTIIGARTLESVMSDFREAGFLRTARDIALSHHERYDGCGYPQGLRKEEIPLCGRIVALADVYDALTSKRIYKPAFSPGVARSIISADSGKHFDPRIVEAFFHHEEDFLAVH